MHAIIAHTLTRGFSIATYFVSLHVLICYWVVGHIVETTLGRDQDENLGPFLFWMRLCVPEKSAQLGSDKVYVLVSDFRALNEGFLLVRKGLQRLRNYLKSSLK